MSHHHRTSKYHTATLMLVLQSCDVGFSLKDYVLCWVSHSETGQLERAQERRRGLVKGSMASQSRQNREMMSR